MRPFEIGLMVVLLCQGVVLVRERPRRFCFPLVFLGMLSLLAQQYLEGFRWQLMPALCLLAIQSLALALVALKRALTGPSRARQIWRGILMGLSLTLSWWLPWSIPVFKIPPPTGPHQVGTTWMTVRRQHLDSTRELMVKLWFPAALVNGDRAEPYWPDARVMSRIMAASWGMPGFIFSHLGLVETHSFPGARLRSDSVPLPVVVFSHGLTQGYPNQNQHLMEDLASHGYLVCSIAHTGETLAVRFPDGRWEAYDHELADKFYSEIQSFRKELLAITLTSNAITPDRFRSLSELIPTPMKRAAVWSLDIKSLLDHLERIQYDLPDHWLHGRIDLTRIAVGGMSFGGASSYETAIDDKRIGAVFNLDGFHYGRALSGEAIQVPYLLFSSETGRSWRNDFVLRDGSIEAVWLTVSDSNHFDFSDFAFFGPFFRTLGPLGPVDPNQLHRFIAIETRVFLDLSLSGQHWSGLASQHTGLEVDVQRFAVNR